MRQYSGIISYLNPTENLMKTYTFKNIQAFQWKTENGYNEIVRQSYEGSDGLQLVPAGYTMQGISKPAIKTANGPQRITCIYNLFHI